MRDARLCYRLVVFESIMHDGIRVWGQGYRGEAARHDGDGGTAVVRPCEEEHALTPGRGRGREKRGGAGFGGEEARGETRERHGDMEAR